MGFEKVPSFDKKQERMKPEEVLKYMAKMGEDLTRNAMTALAMLEEAKAKGIEVDLSTSQTLSKFEAPNGEYENQLINIRQALGSIGSELFNQGVKMTQADVQKRLELMQKGDAKPEEVINKEGEGLGKEKNIKIAEYLIAGNFDGLFQIISKEQDKQKACEVILNSMFEFNQGSRTESVIGLLKTALSNPEQYGPALKELVLYTWQNNLRGERLWKHPSKEEFLFIDDDGELISFQGKIETHSQGPSKGMNYIDTLAKYTVLTGPNTGKVFDGSYAAGQRNDPNYRPIKGPEMK